MEKFDQKLHAGPVLAAKRLKQLVQHVRKTGDSKKEYPYLKDKCLNEISVISDLAAETILELVELSVLPVETVLTDFVINIFSTKKLPVLIRILNRLLCMQSMLGNIGAKYKDLLDHPLVKVLQKDTSIETQLCIYSEIEKTLSTRKATNRDFVQALYLYCLCSPQPNIDVSVLRHKLWGHLLQDEQNGTRFMLKLCSWLQVEKNSCQLSGYLLDEVIQAQLIQQTSSLMRNLDSLILLQLLVIYNMTLNNLSCCQLIRNVLRIIPKTSSFCHYNLALLMLSKSVIACSPLHIEDLLQLCFLLASHQTCKPYSFMALKSALLYWLASPDSLTKPSLKMANEILKLEEHVCRNRPVILVSRLNIDRFHHLFYCNREIFLALQLGIKWECCKDSDEFIGQLNEVPLPFLKDCFTFVCGLLLDRNLRTEQKVKVLDIVMKCASSYVELLPVAFVLILHVLTIGVSDRKLCLELLKVLPRMAKSKENLTKVVATLQEFAKYSPSLGCFATKLMYDTWEVDNECYPALEKTFGELTATTIEDVWAINLTKASILTKLAEKNSQKYGTDLVAQLSKVLNECATEKGAVPSALAIDGIRHLCRAGTIDIVTTWAALFPKFKMDARNPVVKRFCQLIGEIPLLDYTQSYEQLNNEAISHLWTVATAHDDSEVVKAALDSLSKFSLEMISAYAPPSLLEEDGVKPTALVSGNTWLKFLATSKFREAYRDFLTKLVFNEIENYLKYVYQVKSHKEPETLHALPSHSIVRALGDFVKINFSRLKSWGNTPNAALYLDCLRILSGQYPKPLPPFNWCFLQEIIHERPSRHLCVDLASRQAIVSGSARRLVENFIVAMTECPNDVEDLICIYKNLKYLANSIQPVILEPFLEKSTDGIRKDLQTFAKILDYLKEVLDDVEIQAVNKHVIEKVLADMVLTMESDDMKILSVLLPIFPSFSRESLETLIAFKNTAKIDEDTFLRTAKIACFLSEHSLNYTSLNDTFKAGFQNDIKLAAYVDDLTSALRANVNGSESPHWLDELLRAIQAKVAERCDVAEIEYFCDVLALAATVFSGLIVLCSKYDCANLKYFFPTAVASLMKQPAWETSSEQLFDWLHYMTTAENVSTEYRRVFAWSLASSRHRDAFGKDSKWIKYLCCDVSTD